MKLFRVVTTRFGFAITLATFAIAAYAQSRYDIAAICDDCIVEKFAACGGFLEGATFDRNGQLWVVDLLSGNLITVETDGRCSVAGNTGGQPNGAKFHRDGRLFVADKRLGIVAFDPESGALETVIDSYRAERLRGVNDLVFDADGGMYFTEPYGSDSLRATGRVFYQPAGADARLEVVSDAFAFPNGIALSPAEDRLYVGEYANKRILSVPPPRTAGDFDVTYVFAAVEGGVGPDGMAVDARGNLYAAIFQGREIRVVSPDGFSYGSIRLPDEAGTFVTNLAFDGDYLYITEASIGEVWRVRVANAGHALFHQR